jgi:integrase
MTVILGAQEHLRPIPVGLDLGDCEKARASIMRATDLSFLPFREAADIWLERHRENIADRTYRDYKFYINSLDKHLGSLLLSQMHIGHVLEYRKLRQATAGAWCINHEIITLKQILEMAGLWDIIGKHYKPLKIENTGPPKVLTPEEEERFFRVVALKPEWEVAYWAVSLTNNTSAYGCELRFLQLKHIFLDTIPPKIHIPDDKVKNEFRARVIPLNETALKQVQRLMQRVYGIAGGFLKPEYYLFPFRLKKGEYQLTKPASAFFIRSAFRSMRKATGLDWLQPRHFRNQIITKLFESGAPDETITSIAGHQAIKMSKYYSRIRLHAKAEALDKISPKGVENTKKKGRA